MPFSKKPNSFRHRILLHDLARKKNLRLLNQILEEASYTEIERQDCQGLTAADVAANSCNIGALFLFMRYGANISLFRVKKSFKQINLPSEDKKVLLNKLENHYRFSQLVSQIADYRQFSSENSKAYIFLAMRNIYKLCDGDLSNLVKDIPPSSCIKDAAIMNAFIVHDSLAGVKEVLNNLNQTYIR